MQKERESGHRLNLYMNINEIQNLIRELIERTTSTIKQITVSDDNPKNICFSIEVSDPHLFLSKGGEALFALNHIVRKIIESKKADDSELNILVDINGFQKKRIENLHATAHMMAERARYFKSNIEVDPMPAFERRIIHEFLSEETDLKTESTGEGVSRRVVIKYIGKI